MAKVLGRKPVKIRRRRTDSCYVAQWACKDFVQWFRNQTLEQLKAVIEASNTTMMAFLRRYVNSDGSVQRYRVSVYGSDVSVPEFVRELCSKLRIRIKSLRSSVEAGNVAVVRGKRVVTRRGFLGSPSTPEISCARYTFSIIASAIRSFGKCLKAIGGHLRQQRRAKKVLKPVRAGTSIKKAAKIVGVPYLITRDWVKHAKNLSLRDSVCPDNTLLNPLSPHPPSGF